MMVISIASSNFVLPYSFRAKPMSLNESDAAQEALVGSANLNIANNCPEALK
jgi:hypothetical protein